MFRIVVVSYFQLINNNESHLLTFTANVVVGLIAHTYQTGSCYHRRRTRDRTIDLDIAMAMLC